MSLAAEGESHQTVTVIELCTVRSAISRVINATVENCKVQQEDKEDVKHLIKSKETSGGDLQPVTADLLLTQQFSQCGIS